MKEPFLLVPVGKYRIWGGHRLNDEYNKNIDIQKLGETWECSTHPDGMSTAASGCYKGRTLNSILIENPEFMGSNPLDIIPERLVKNGELPILVKFIDADSDLSVQVHPDDAYAAQNENGQLGKTEMWYVADAGRDAKLVYGLNRDIDRDTLKKSIIGGTLEKHLQKVNVKTDDVFFVPSGTIHAVGKGALIAEIQENSDLTYRLYDYDRIDRDGKKRELHIDKALDCACLKASKTPVQPMRVLKYKNGWASELLCRCRYFNVERILLNTERQKQMVTFATSSLSFAVMLCMKGCGTVIYKNGMLPFFKGDCIFVPAGIDGIKVHGTAQLLKISC